MADDELKSKGRKRSKETVNAFFAWRKAYLVRLFARKETKQNMRLFGLAFYLSEHFDWEDYACWPSRETIAEAIGVEVRTVSTLTRKLEEMGFLRVKRRGPDMSALYVGMLPVDAQSNAHQEAQRNAHQDAGSDRLKRNPTSLDAQLNCNQTCNGLQPNDYEQRSFEREGAAQAAPLQSTNNISASGGPALANASRSPSGEEDDYLADDPSFADQDEFIDDDDEGGIPYDAKSSDHPEAQSADPRDTHCRDLLTRCLRREPELAADERQRLHTIFARFRNGNLLASADLEALASMVARLEGNDEFTDDMAAIRPDLTEPAAERVMMEATHE